MASQTNTNTHTHAHVHWVCGSLSVPCPSIPFFSDTPPAFPSGEAANNQKGNDEDENTGRPGKRRQARRIRVRWCSRRDAWNNGIGMWCNDSPGSGPAERALWLGNNKPESLRSAGCKHKVFNSTYLPSTHITPPP